MAKKIRVLLVDDSASVRSSLIAGLSAEPDIDVVGSARDGLEAVEQVKALTPDVVTLDIEMPRLDGLGALERIMVERPTPVVMVSSLTRKGAEVTIQALELGAVDFALKTATRGSSAVRGLIAELAEKIRQAATANVKALVRQADSSEQIPVALRPEKETGSSSERVVVIASSTGGPQALRAVIPFLPANLPAPVLVIQHLPAGFTSRLAASLDKASPLTVEEARPGVQLSAGLVLVAPGGVHMTLSKAGSIRLSLADPECGVRPAANVTMESVASVYGEASVGVVLTGMGADGTRGAGLIKRAGGTVIVEDKSTCVIYGMPKSVTESGHTDEEVPLPRIASRIVRACWTRARKEEAAV